LAGCILFNIAFVVSDYIFIGNKRATTYSEVVDHWYFFIEERIWGDRPPFIGVEFLDWEDRDDFNFISDCMLYVR
jgi:hypothetical protein